MKIILLALLLGLPSCARIKAGWEASNQPPVWGAYGPYGILKSPLSSPYCVQSFYPPLTHCP